MRSTIILCAVVLSLGACANARDTRLTEGAVIGATTGAIIGGVTNSGPGGVIVGGVVGAATGAVIADATRPRHGKTRCYYDNNLGRRVCHYR